MLLTKQVKTKWSRTNRKRYEELGYVYTRMGDELTVKVEHLLKGSHCRIKYKCDRCGKITEITYQAYCKNKGDIDLCHRCINGQSVERYRQKYLKNGNTLNDWFKENNLDIDKYWDYEKNKCLPTEVSKCCNMKVWIKCQEKDYHGSYEITCSGFTNQGQRCPYCSGKKVNPKDSLGQYIIDNYGEEFFNKVWSEDNQIFPFEITPSSRKVCIWKCYDCKHEDFKRTAKDSKRSNFRCSKCSIESKDSLYEKEILKYLNSIGYDVKKEFDCTLRVENPKTNRVLPYDNEIVLENGKHLIIEVHGGQHYECGFYFRYYKLSELEAQERLHRRQVLDRYKRIKCKQLGYEYLEIPYWLFNKNKEYKRVIDNKIQKILSMEN